MWCLVACIMACLCLSSAVEIKQISVLTVTGIKGGSAALPCDVSHPPDDTIFLILWFRDNLTTLIYRFDDRSLSRGGKSHWFDEDKLGMRAVLDVTASSAHLRLSSLHLSDRGFYKCRVDFKLQPTKTTRVVLNVVVPPVGVRVTVGTPGSTARPVTRVVGPYLEGDIISLNCISHGGTPQPNIIWYEGSTIIDQIMESEEPVVTESPDVNFNTSQNLWPAETTPVTLVTSGPLVDAEAFNTLTLGPLARGDLKKLLTCRASNNNITAAVSTTVIVEMNLPPLSVMVRPPEEQLTAGKEYHVICEVRGTRPAPSITWWNGDMRLPKAMHTQSTGDENTTTSSLVIKPTALDDGSTLKCVAESPQTNTTLEDSATLSVYYIPVASATFGSSLDSSNIKEGDDVYFECVIKANPRVTQVSWKLNDELLVHDVSAGVIVSNQSLVLQRVTRSQAGQYTCHAQNILGSGSSNSLQLDVKYAPVCLPGQVTTYAVGRYEDAEVTCEVEANPLEATFQWTFNNTADTIDVPQGRYTSTNSHSVITYTPMTSLDYGTLLCWASNEIGSQQEPCLYHIIPAGKPEPPGNCTVIQRTRTSVRISCMPGNSGGLKQSFVLQARLHNGKHTINVTSGSPVFQVDGLRPKQRYNLYITAFNDKGTSSPTLLAISSIGTANFIYQLHDGPSEAEVRDGGKTPSGNGASFGFGNKYLENISLPSLIPAALGVGAGLILVIIVLILLIVFRTRRPRNPPSCSSLTGSELSKTGSKSPSMTPKQTTSCSERDLQVESESDAEPDVIPLQEGFRGTEPDPSLPAATLLPPDCYQYPASSTTSLIHSMVNPHHIRGDVHAAPSPTSASVTVPLLQEGFAESYVPPSSSSYAPHQQDIHLRHHHPTHPDPHGSLRDHQLPMSSAVARGALRHPITSIIITLPSCPSLPRATKGATPTVTRSRMWKGEACRPL
ncbi:LOW QUALITY PROTEIN: nephrin-like [Macrobrachium rosenbergii]|uniref:LOW QUALITY PROTEIN: nephrin-like n=1 Tax=Macrobrachium rosenbergii TaxID=79674 RepID=UPI0034D73621